MAKVLTIPGIQSARVISPALTLRVTDSVRPTTSNVVAYGATITPGVYQFTIPGPAPGAVRQTQSDKWKKRPCVVKYREWCDLARSICHPLPPANRVRIIKIVAHYEPPVSWSKRARAAVISHIKRTKPDGDNILKACADALWKNDEALGDQAVSRRYDWTARLEITIHVS